MGNTISRGKIRWEKYDPALPLLPASSLPPNLWVEPEELKSQVENYVYIEYTPLGSAKPVETKIIAGSDADFHLSSLERGISINVDALSKKGFAVGGSFQQGSKMKFKEIETGYYLQDLPTNNRLKSNFEIGFAGLNSVVSHDCDGYSGWFVIDSVEYLDGNPLKADVRFEMTCNGLVRGKIHIVNNDRVFAKGGDAIPDNLWQPSSGLAPEQGNYIVLQGDPGDYVSNGGDYVYTQVNSLIKLDLSTIIFQSSSRLQISVKGYQNWNADIYITPDHIKLEKGYYSFDSGNGQNMAWMSWGGEGRGCNEASGWFVVDFVDYDLEGNLNAIDLRFKQSCEKSASHLYGKIHWNKSDLSSPLGPKLPVPTNLWQPSDVPSLPGKNYVYLQSDAGDFVGGGQNYFISSPETKIIIEHIEENHIGFRGEGALYFFGSLTGNHFANQLIQLEEGYYDLSAGRNITLGASFWTVDHRGCNDTKGWFAIDHLLKDSGNNVLEIDFRFEQRCDNSLAALRGKIHWRADDL